MSVYILFIFLLTGLTSLSSKKEYVRVSTFLFFVSCVFFICFRFETGSDWLIYKREFLDINFDNNFYSEIFRLSKEHSHEPFFSLSVYVLKYITNSFFYTNFLGGIFILNSYYCLSKNYNINSNYFTLILLLFLIFTVHFSIIRQSVAMAFVNFGIIAWNKNDLWKLLLFFLLAFLFHNTSIIFITIFAVSIYISRALGNKIPFVLYGLIALLYFIPKEITVSGDHRLITKINHYFNYIYYTNPLKTIYLIGFYLLIILLITKVHKKINQQHPDKLFSL